MIQPADLLPVVYPARIALIFAMILRSRSRQAAILFRFLRLQKRFNDDIFGCL